MKIYGLVLLLRVVSAHASEPSDEDTARAWSGKLSVRGEICKLALPPAELQFLSSSSLHQSEDVTPSCAEWTDIRYRLSLVPWGIPASSLPVVVDAQSVSDAHTILKLIKKRKNQDPIFSDTQEKLLIRTVFRSGCPDHFEVCTHHKKNRQEALEFIFAELSDEFLEQVMTSQLERYTQTVSSNRIDMLAQRQQGSR